MLLQRGNRPLLLRSWNLRRLERKFSPAPSLSFLVGSIGDQWTADTVADRQPPAAVPDDVEAISLRQRIMARLRGHQTLPALRRRGLRAHPPVRLVSPSYIDPVFAWAIEIGSYTIISQEVQIFAHDAAIKRLTGYTEVRPVTIGERCYIGAGSIILPGTTIGDESIIGAGSLVRGVIPPRCLAYGVPAKVAGSIDELRRRHERNLLSAPRSDRRIRDLNAEELAVVSRDLERHGRLYAP
jgi:maltose O-acetyltransferase